MMNWFRSLFRDPEEDKAVSAILSKLMEEHDKQEALRKELETYRRFSKRLLRELNMAICNMPYEVPEVDEAFRKAKKHNKNLNKRYRKARQNENTVRSSGCSL